MTLKLELQLDIDWLLVNLVVYFKAMALEWTTRSTKKHWIIYGLKVSKWFNHAAAGKPGVSGICRDNWLCRIAALVGVNAQIIYSHLLHWVHISEELNFTDSIDNGQCDSVDIQHCAIVWLREYSELLQQRDKKIVPNFSELNKKSYPFRHTKNTLSSTVTSHSRYLENLTVHPWWW